MDARLQRRVQRYGWDRAATRYEALWQAHLAVAQREMLRRADPRPGERVLDLACGTGAVALAAACAVSPGGHTVGVDLSGRMVDAARGRAADAGHENASFLRMDGEALAFADADFDVALCAFGLMYMPEPERALVEMRRVLRPGGRVGLAVWGERARCGWAALFGIVDREVASEVCPLFFRLGQGDLLARACAAAGFDDVQLHRIESTLDHVDADDACEAALVGGPVALAWSRMDSDARARVRGRYLESLAPWREGAGFRVPAEFVVVSATAASGG